MLTYNDALDVVRKCRDIAVTLAAASANEQGDQDCCASAVATSLSVLCTELENEKGEVFTYGQKAPADN